MYDILIVGSGPAGLSAAVNARARNKSAAVISNRREDSGLYKAGLVDNYPGLPGLSGAELSDKLAAHALEMGAEIIHGRVTSVLCTKDGVSAGYGAEVVTGRALILALGVVQTSVFPGEAEFLGRGVSYCATCDGMLYRGRRVAVVSLSPGAGEEAEYLRSIGCDVTVVETKDITVNGADKVASVTADGAEIPCDAAFILRPAVSPSSLLPGLRLDGGFIAVARDMATNITGVFAAGDCAGAPFQIAKAVGEGQTAALSAAKYIAATQEAGHEISRRKNQTNKPV